MVLSIVTERNVGFRVQKRNWVECGSFKGVYRNHVGVILVLGLDIVISRTRKWKITLQVDLYRHLEELLRTGKLN